MLRLRPYKACDAEAVVSWTGDEIAFRKWSADRFDTYPITAEDLNRHYDAMAYSDSFYEMTAFDAGGPVGHMIMRFTDEEKRTLRFGFVIVDSKKRGMGYGREMLTLAVRWAFGILKAERITLGVFENNEPAYRCYRAAGFRDVMQEESETFRILGEDWNCLELALERSEWETQPVRKEGGSR
ncbi:MAG: GNAT family N-acetyltransferase [Clostridia bacterium]|nr:GNAT family N-acetyltransferase [Clostridia bacterium]